MAKEYWSTNSSRKKLSAAAVSAGAAVVIALVAVVTFVISTSGSADADDAVHLEVIQEPFVHDRWIVPPDVQSGPPAAGNCTAPELHARRHWLQAHEGIPVGFTVARVEVVNDSDKTLLVESLRLSNAQKLPSPKGATYALCPRGGGGPPEDQYAMINFDERPLGFRLFNELYEPVPAVDFSPSPHHPLRFWILATSSTAHFRWRATLVYSLDGEIHRLAIPGSHASFAIAPE